MDLFLTIVDFLWNNIMVEVMVVIALWFTIKTKAVQITMFPEMIRTLKGSTQKQSKDGRSISSVEAFLISLASRVGVGNLAGVALAITIGGPGAIFWMWVMAILNSATSFVESTLAQLYKSRNGNFFIGGPAYYIYKGLKSKTWAVIVAILSVLTFSFIICSVQSNTIAISAGQAFGITPIWSAIIIGVLMSLTIFGGVGRVAKVTSTLVPLMAFAYILVVVSIVLANIGQIPAIFKLIIDSAFGVDQVVAGGVGTAIMMGIKRGLFSNEAGMGSAPNAAATADVSHPVNQGFVQAMGVFVDTLVICSCTAFLIFIGGADAPDNLEGIALTQYALSAKTGGWAYHFIAIIIFFFGFSTCISNSYYGEANIRFIKDSNLLVNIFRVLMILIVMAGAIIPLDVVWAMADLFMIFIVLINLISITKLGKYTYLLLDNYKSQKKKGIQAPVFKKSQIKELDTPNVECW